MDEDGRICLTITAVLTVLSNAGEGDLYGDFELELPNYEDSLNLPRYQSNYGGDDVFHFQYCYNPSKDSTKFFLYVDAWGGGDFTITVSTKVRSLLRSITELLPYQYSFEAVMKGRVRCPKSSSVTRLSTFYCYDYTYSCSTLWFPYPASSFDSVDIFWPPPAAWSLRKSTSSSIILSNLDSKHEVLDKNAFDYKSTDRIHVLSSTKKRAILSYSKSQKPSNKLYTVVVFETNLFGTSNYYIEEEELARCQFDALGTLFNKEGNAVLPKSKSSKFLPMDDSCDSRRVRGVISRGSELITKVQQTKDNFNALLRGAFQVDSLLFTGGWTACNSFANSFLVSSDDRIEQPSTACYNDNENSKSWLEDPCCNPQLRLTTCCLPRNETVEQTVFHRVNNSLVDKLCQASDCSTYYLTDLLTLNQQGLRCNSFSSQEYPDLLAQDTTFYQKCKAKYDLDSTLLGQEPCITDRECNQGGGKCNPITKRCTSSFDAEKKALRCMVDALDVYQEYFLKEHFGLKGNKEDDSYLEGIEKALSIPTCVDRRGHPTNIRSRWELTPQCSEQNSCPPNICLDSSCVVESDQCSLICGPMAQVPVWEEIQSTKKQCDSSRKCNWKSSNCDPEAETDCEEDCAPESLTRNFCGYCEDEAHCQEIPGVTSKEECEVLEVCRLPSGQLQLMSKEQCRDFGQCSQNCPGQTCQSSLGDICISPQDELSCGGQWIESQCVYTYLSEDLCTRAGFQYLSCSSLSLDECQPCASDAEYCPPPQTLLQCHLSSPLGVPCESKSDCEKHGGYCDDAKWRDMTTPLTSYNESGYCITYPTVAYYQELPLCSYGEVIPEGCVDISYGLSEETCNENLYYYETAGLWKPLASNKDECLEPKGCLNPEFQQRFLLPKSKKDCSECGGKYESYYKWTDGYWIKGKPVKPKWTKRRVVPLFEWSSSAFDFSVFYQAITDASRAKVFTDIQSQTACVFYGKSQALSAISCSCAEKQVDDPSDCFPKDLVVESGTGRPCIGLGSKVQTVLASFEVTATAVGKKSSDRCVDVVISTITINDLQTPDQIPFTPLTRAREYDTFNVVRNSDSAIVGRVIGDGVKVELSNDIRAMTLCLRESSQASGRPKKSFKVYDFGIRFKDDSKKLEPMGFDLQENGQGEFCANITDPPRREEYFLIVRQESWRSISGSLYLSGETAAWWTFGGLFGVAALMAGAIFFTNFFSFRLHFFFVTMVGAFAVMCAIRSVYFFLLAGRVFEDLSTSVGVVPFILIELPTLLYFTAFSTLAGFWIWLIYKDHRKKVPYYFAIFNALLYLLFVVLVILFSTLPSDGEESQCENILPTKEDDTNYKILSIFYQGFMSGVSLLIACLILAFAGKLYVWVLKKKGFERRVLLLTAFCAFGLLLHCAFILYLSIEFTDDFPVVVLLVVLAELLPIFWITFQFGPMRGNCFGVTVTLPDSNKFITRMKSRTISNSSSDKSKTNWEIPSDPSDPSLPTTAAVSL